MSRNTLTQNQQLFLIYLAQFRFLTIKTATRLFNYKDTHLVRNWIKKLEGSGYIQQCFYKDDSTFPQTTIYCLDRNGKEYLIRYCDITRIYFRWHYKEASHSQRFITHHLLLVNTYLVLRPALKYINSQITFFEKRNLLINNTFEEYTPDLIIQITKENKRKKFLFIEVLDYFTPMKVHKKRCYSLLEEMEMNDLWSKQAKPTILYVCPNNTVAYFMKRYFEYNKEDFTIILKASFIQEKDLTNHSVESLTNLL